MTAPAAKRRGNNPSRKARGRQSEKAVAAYLALNGWPYAEAVGSGTPGADITGTPGVAIEVKARRDLNLTGWLRQACARPGVAMVCHRPDGYGPATVADWPVTMRLADVVTLLRAAGYGGES